MGFVLVFISSVVRYEIQAQIMKGHILTGVMLSVIFMLVHGEFNPFAILVMAVLGALIGLVLGVLERFGAVKLYDPHKRPPE